MVPTTNRRLVPPDLPLYGAIPLNKPICDYDEPVEDYLGLLPTGPPTGFEEYGPSKWGHSAYIKSFEKFFYAPGCNYAQKYPESTRFADRALLAHINYLRGCRVVHISATDKNLDSTTAIPKCMTWPTEADFLEDQGWGPYVSEFARIDRGARPRVLWYLFLKKEILKCEKINQGDIRQIVCSDPIFARIGACLEQAQNQKMKDATEYSSGQCGWTPFFGGFEQRMARLSSKPGHFIEFDWTRFDGTIPMSLLMRIKKIRWQLMDATHRERYKHIHKWYCSNIAKRYVCMPSGEITLQDRGNPSGQISTTMDNNLVNYWLQAFEYHYLGCDPEQWVHYDTLVYGDDRLTRHPCLPENYETRVIAMYKDIFGMWVKPDKIKVSTSLVGLTFCGFTIKANFLPEPTQPYKLLASLLKPYKTVPDIDSFHGKLLSYQILSHFLDDGHPFKEYIKKAIAHVYPSTSRLLPKSFTSEQLDRLWRGGPKVIANG